MSGRRRGGGGGALGPMENPQHADTLKKKNETDPQTCTLSVKGLGRSDLETARKAPNRNNQQLELATQADFAGDEKRRRERTRRGTR